MSPAPSEEGLVAWLRTLTARAGFGRSRGTLIGDDAATLPNGTVVTVDQQIEGVHFPAGLAPAVVARRLLAVNLSDIAASGARPRFAFLALAAPPGFDHRSFSPRPRPRLRRVRRRRSPAAISRSRRSFTSR